MTQPINPRDRVVTIAIYRALSPGIKGTVIDIVNDHARITVGPDSTQMVLPVYALARVDDRLAIQDALNRINSSHIPDRGAAFRLTQLLKQCQTTSSDCTSPASTAAISTAPATASSATDS